MSKQKLKVKPQEEGPPMEKLWQQVQRIREQVTAKYQRLLLK